jgi:hypothetical protein
LFEPPGNHLRPSGCAPGGLVLLECVSSRGLLHRSRASHPQPPICRSRSRRNGLMSAGFQKARPSRRRQGWGIRPCRIQRRMVRSSVRSSLARRAVPHRQTGSGTNWNGSSCPRVVMASPPSGEAGRRPSGVFGRAAVGPATRLSRRDRKTGNPASPARTRTPIVRTPDRSASFAPRGGARRRGRDGAARRAGAGLACGPRGLYSSSAASRGHRQSDGGPR